MGYKINLAYSKGDKMMVTTKALPSLWDNFNTLTPHVVGFDRMFDMLTRDIDSYHTGGFPPYNIRKEGEFNHVIEMALAGFGKKDIEVELSNGTLTIRSVKENSDDDDSTVYRGIAYRKFERKFTIADDVVVNDAKLENGMLLISLERIIPEEKKPRLIDVK